MTFAGRSKITAITVYDLSFLGEVNLAVMNKCCGGFQVSYQTIFDVGFGVQFVAITRFSSFFGPSPVFVAPGFCSGSAWFIHLFMTKISGYECSVLYHAFINLQTLHIKLSLQLTPDFFVFACFF